MGLQTTSPLGAWELCIDHPDHGGDIGRKRAGLGSLLGDWTLRLPQTPGR